MITYYIYNSYLIRVHQPSKNSWPHITLPKNHGGIRLRYFAKKIILQNTHHLCIYISFYEDMIGYV